MSKVIYIEHKIGTDNPKVSGEYFVENGKDMLKVFEFNAEKNQWFYIHLTDTTPMLDEDAVWLQRKNVPEVLFEIIEKAEEFGSTREHFLVKSKPGDSFMIDINSPRNRTFPPNDSEKENFGEPPILGGTHALVHMNQLKGEHAQINSQFFPKEDIQEDLKQSPSSERLTGDENFEKKEPLTPERLENFLKEITFPKGDREQELPISVNDPENLTHFIDLRPHINRLTETQKRILATKSYALYDWVDRAICDSGKFDYDTDDGFQLSLEKVTGRVLKFEYSKLNIEQIRYLVTK